MHQCTLPKKPKKHIWWWWRGAAKKGAHLIFGDLLLHEVDADDRFRRRSVVAAARVSGDGAGDDGARASLHEVRLTLFFVVALESSVQLQELVVDVRHPEDQHFRIESLMGGPTASFSTLS